MEHIYPILLRVLAKYPMSKCDDCGKPVPHIYHKERLGLCPDCYQVYCQEMDAMMSERFSSNEDYMRGMEEGGAWRP